LTEQAELTVLVELLVLMEQVDKAELRVQTVLLVLQV
jgi:hypothetical protein